MPTGQTQIRNRAGLPVAPQHLLLSAFTAQREEVGLSQTDLAFYSFIYANFHLQTPDFLKARQSSIYHDHNYDVATTTERFNQLYQTSGHESFTRTIPVPFWDLVLIFEIEF